MPRARRVRTLGLPNRWEKGRGLTIDRAHALGRAALIASVGYERSKESPSTRSATRATLNWGCRRRWQCAVTAGVLAGLPIRLSLGRTISHVAHAREIG